MIKRQLESDLKRLAVQYPVVTLTGPRQSGKTTLCQYVFSDYDYVNLEDLDKRLHAVDDPKDFLSRYDNTVILDEIQRAPDLPSYIQSIVDANDNPGQFILTGSQQFEVTHAINQSLAGRSAILRLLPLSLTELYTADNCPSVSELLYTGFYPRIHAKQLQPTEALSFYLLTYVERDIRSLINIKELLTFERFLKLCASQVGQLVNLSRLANDCGVSQRTIQSWLSILEASYIIYEVAPHFENFRKRLTKSTKLYFYDVGLAAYLLGVSNPDQMRSHPIKGELFENLIMTEVLKERYNHVQESNSYFFRDHVGNEVDLILDYGSYLVSVEIKSAKTINMASLKSLKQYQQMAGDKNKLSCLIYAGDESYQQQGIHIISYKDIQTFYDLLEVTSIN